VASSSRVLTQRELNRAVVARPATSASGRDWKDSSATTWPARSSGGASSRRWWCGTRSTSPRKAITGPWSWRFGPRGRRPGRGGFSVPRTARSSAQPTSSARRSAADPSTWKRWRRSASTPGDPRSGSTSSGYRRQGPGSAVGPISTPSRRTGSGRPPRCRRTTRSTTSYAATSAPSARPPAGTSPPGPACASEPSLRRSTAWSW